jgi:fructose-1,6-bisphosphatase/inositol monophosphatase family enzyme
MLIVQEAGGRFTQLEGAPISIFGENRGILATNGALHEEAITWIDWD